MNETNGGQSSSTVSASVGALKARRLGVDTHDEAVVFLRQESHVCRAEGFAAHARVRLTYNGRSLIATLYQVSSDIVALDEAGLSIRPGNDWGSWTATRSMSAIRTRRHR